MDPQASSDNDQQILADIHRIWKQADCIHDEQKVNCAIDRLAQDITSEYQHKNPVCIGLMKGAITFMGKLMTRLPFPLQIDYCNASRYGDALQGGVLNWRHYPTECLDGRHVLFVDDIFDEGKTLMACSDWALGQGAASVASVVLVEKTHDRKPACYRPRFVGLKVPDVFVVGYGMDYKDYFRNANGIFAIQP